MHSAVETMKSHLQHLTDEFRGKNSAHSVPKLACMSYEIELIGINQNCIKHLFRSL